MNGNVKIIKKTLCAHVNLLKCGSVWSYDVLKPDQKNVYAFVHNKMCYYPLTQWHHDKKDEMTSWQMTAKQKSYFSSSVSKNTW